MVSAKPMTWAVGVITPHQSYCYKCCKNVWLPVQLVLVLGSDPVWSTRGLKQPVTYLVK
jgi:hypothetical protein